MEFNKRQLAKRLGIVCGIASLSVCTYVGSSSRAVEESDRGVNVTQSRSPLIAIRDVEVLLNPSTVVQQTLQEAVTIAKTVLDPSERAGILRDLAEAQSLSRDASEAKKTYRLSVKAAEALKDDPAASSARSEKLRSISISQATVGLIRDALRTAAMIEDRHEASKALSAIARVQMKAGDFKAALQTILDLGVGDKAAELLADLAASQAEAGHAEDAWRWAQSLTSPTTRSRVLLGIADGIARRIRHDPHEKR